MIEMIHSRAVAILIAGLTALADVAAAQTDAFTVDLRPLDGAAEGNIELYCGPLGDAVVRLGEYPRSLVVNYVIWSFDGQGADTTFIVSGSFNRADAQRFVAGLRGARSLELVNLGSDPGGPRVKYSYDVRALGRRVQNAACVRDPAAHPPARRWPPPEGLVANPPQDSTRSETRIPADPAKGTYDLTTVDEMPELVNRQDLRRAIERNYPPQERDAGVGGRVEVRFRILEDGRIDPGSIQVERSTHDAFVEPVQRLLPMLHFRPARVGGRPVKVWVTLPIEFATAN